MKIEILSQYGLMESLFGLGFSFGKTSDLTYDQFLADADLVERMKKAAKKLSNMDGGHNKFLESLVFYIDITAPISWWVQADTYRVGISKQSASTMHTLRKTKLTQEHFESKVQFEFLEFINNLIENNVDIDVIKDNLPCGFLQRRLVCANGKCLRNIVLQRRHHELKAWHTFCDSLKDNMYYEYLGLDNV